MQLLATQKAYIIMSAAGDLCMHVYLVKSIYYSRQYIILVLLLIYSCHMMTSQ